MTTFLILTAIYILGFFICHFMLLTELKSEIKQDEFVTKGDFAVSILLSVFSFFTILYLLSVTWVKHIGATGYWNKPIKEPKNATE